MKKITVATICCLAMVAHADFLSGNDLLEKMTDKGMAARMVALGYVVGVSDASYTYAHCMPKDVSSKQANDVVLQLLERNPSMRHYSAESLVVKALSETWPCKKSDKGNPNDKNPTANRANQNLL